MLIWQKPESTTPRIESGNKQARPIIGLAIEDASQCICYEMSSLHVMNRPSDDDLNIKRHEPHRVPNISLVSTGEYQKHQDQVNITMCFIFTLPDMFDRKAA